MDVVLVLRALGLGDLLTAVPALRALARAFPSGRRILACPPVLAPLVAATGAVHEVLPAEPLRPLVAAPVGAIGVNLHGRGPQSHRVLLGARPRRLIAFGHPAVAASRGLPEWRADEHEVRRWCRMLEECGIDTDPTDLSVPRPAVRPPVDVTGATVVHPGAALPSRRWPPDRWAAVARSETDGGRRVVVTGAPEEISLARWVAEEAGVGRDAVLAGRTDLLALAAVVGGASRLVSGDTGVAHLATALGTPSVVLFGPTSPDRWGPPPGRERHISLWAGKEGDQHRPFPDPGLLEIGVRDVVAALERLSPFAPGSPGERIAGIYSIREDEEGASMSRCPVCASVRVVLLLNGERRAFCGRCGSRWVQDGSRQSSIERRAAEQPPADRPA